MRCFIAIAPPDDVRQKIAQFADECAEAFPGKVKPVSVSNLHLTLSFLGETDPSRFEEIFSALETLRFPRFCLEARGAGFFPDDGSSPRVLWAGTAPSEELHALNALCEKTVEGLGFPRTSPAFVPHFTVGRVKGAGDEALAPYIYKNKTLPFGRFAVEKFSFFISDLSGRDPVYTAVRDFEFI